MLTKLTRSNQVTIPKEIIKRMGIKPENEYFDVKYANGIIYLKPVDIEERIPPEVFEKFQKSVLRIEEGDIVTGKKESRNILKRRARKK